MYSNLIEKLCEWCFVAQQDFEQLSAFATPFILKRCLCFATNVNILFNVNILTMIFSTEGEMEVANSILGWYPGGQSDVRGFQCHPGHPSGYATVSGVILTPNLFYVKKDKTLSAYIFSVQFYLSMLTLSHDTANLYKY